MRTQRGLSLTVLLLVALVVGLLLLLGLKLVPVFTEYYGLKSVVALLVKTQSGAPPSDIRAAFTKRALIEDVTSVKAEDLDITQDKDATAVSVAYDKEVHLFLNVGLVFHFQVENRSSGTS